MYKNKSQIYSILLISLCFTSLVYFNQKNDILDFVDPSISDYTDQIENINPDTTDLEDISDSPDTSSLLVKKVDTPGSYQLQAYFFHNDELEIDNDGLGWELDEYEDMKDDGANSASIRPRFDSTGSSEYEHTMPATRDMAIDAGIPEIEGNPVPCGSESIWESSSLFNEIREAVVKSYAPKEVEQTTAPAGE